MSDKARSAFWGKWGIIFGGWLLLGVLFAGQAIFSDAMKGDGVKWNGVALRALGILQWAAFTPLVFWVCRTFPFDRASWSRTLLAHAAAACVLIPSDAAVYFFSDHLFFKSMYWEPSMPIARRYVHLLSHTFGFSVFFYAGVVGISLAFDYHRLFRERERRAAELEGRLAQAQLQVLKTQLQPHFLFNALNTISALVHEDPTAADRMITQLSDLLRRSLKSHGGQLVTLREEIDFLLPYVEIERTRFQDRLKVDFAVAEDTLDARVPSLLLQPLVENALRHGLAPRAAPGRVEVRADRANGTLRLQVRDDGVGIGSHAALREGIGLGNTRARLQQIYGERHKFEMTDAPGGGLVVAMEIPYEPGASA